MKSRIALKLFIFFVVLKVIIAVLTSGEIHEEFEKFKEQYEKKYKNKFDEYKARKNFAATLKMITAHNEAFERGDQSFRMDLNKFADLDVEEIRALTTNSAPAVPLVNGRAIGVLNETKFPPGPPTVDWRSTGCITDVKDQSYFCNSCYAFSGIAALEAHWCLRTGRKVTLSEQQIIDCNYDAYYGNYGCRGGSQATAYVYIMNNGGIEGDDTYPYAEWYPHTNRFPCKFNKTNVKATTSGYWRIRPFREPALANVIALAGPVSASMNGSTPSFWYYSSGVYSDVQCTPSTSHSVLIVGYGTDYENNRAVDYWLCKNSWSNEWGDAGYFKISRGNNMCGISNFLIYPDIPVANITFTTTTSQPWIG